MKKFLSVLLSLVLCASVTVTNPPVEMGDQIFAPHQEEQYEDGDYEVSPCEDAYPSGAGESNG